MGFLFVLLALPAVFGLFCIAYALLANRIRRLPPGPPPLPSIGNLLQISKPIDECLWRWRAKYGPVFTVWMPRPTVVIMRHKEVHEALVTNADAFAGRPQHETLVSRATGGHYGLVLEDNAIWKPQRRFALHILRDLGIGTSGMQDTITALTKEIIDKLKDASGTDVDLQRYIMYISANVIWQLNFGHTVDYDDPMIVDVKRSLDQILVLQKHPFYLILDRLPMAIVMLAYLLDNVLFRGILKRFMEHGSVIQRILEKELAAAEASTTIDTVPNCYVEAFIVEQSKLKSKGDGDGELQRVEADASRSISVGSFTRPQLSAAASEMWGAGFETTSSTVYYAFHYLMEYPEVQRKMHEELDAKIDRDTDIRMEHQRSLPYCCSVIQELQRIAILSPEGVLHLTKGESTIGGFSIPAGTDTMPLHQHSMNDGELFPRPDRFVPERFISENGEFIKDPRVIPFGAGKRSCPGEALARMEVFLILTSLVRSFSFSSPGPVPPKLETLEGVVRTPAPYKIHVQARA